LGDVSGIELRHSLKAKNISVPMIYMTGKDSLGIREAAHQSGCLAYLTKPFSAAALAANLQRAVRRSR
jgi:FixJ family two-component response regulator